MARDCTETPATVVQVGKSCSVILLYFNNSKESAQRSQTFVVLSITVGYEQPEPTALPQKTH